MYRPAESGISATNYRKLLLGSAISNLGDGVSFVAIPLLAVALTRNPALLAGLSFAYSLPRLLMSTFSGVLADRSERRRMLVAVSVLRGLLLVALATAVALHAASIWMLYGVFVLLGLLETLADTSAFVLLPSVVEADGLTRANSQLSAAQTVLDEIMGPPLGGLLIGIGAALAVATDAASFLVAAVFFWMIRGVFRPTREELAETASPSTMRSELKEGLAYLFGHRTLLPLALSNFLANLAYMMPFSLLALYATKKIGLTPAEYGIALSVSALGSLLGTVVASPLQRRLGTVWALRSMVLLGVAAFAVLAVTSSPVVMTVALAVYFVNSTVWTICYNTWRQQLIPDHLRGRVGAATRSFGLLGLVIGSALAAVAGPTLGLRAPFWLAAGALGIAVLLPLSEAPQASAEESENRSVSAVSPQTQN
ncbi:MFS transporter [Streptacidiphilus fuscans]|uniref:MFS transporter n=1 Tax=Streptacidiphilus fuscans TaxID=2789292 RepID=A0A931BAD7_9ACTN|nr:MFS transporter [Streptacidiphilus fuscans]MBF9069810.1 MFS transporter [Streptacidiphilus fuscans]